MVPGLPVTALAPLADTLADEAEAWLREGLGSAETSSAEEIGETRGGGIPKINPEDAAAVRQVLAALDSGELTEPSNNAVRAPLRCRRDRAARIA